MEHKASDYRVEMDKVGSRIREIRKKKHIRMSEMEEFFGLYPQTMYKWERGDTLPNVENLIALSNFLGVSIDRLLTGRDFAAA